MLNCGDNKILRPDCIEQGPFVPALLSLNDVVTIIHDLKYRAWSMLD